MKRYDVVLGRSGGRPHARCDETPEGAYVRHYVAQKVIDALKAENAELLSALESIVEMNPPLPMGMIEAAEQAIAKAKGESK